VNAVIADVLAGLHRTFTVMELVGYGLMTLAAWAWKTSLVTAAAGAGVTIIVCTLKTWLWIAKMRPRTVRSVSVLLLSPW